jgi:hypothetical protein
LQIYGSDAQALSAHVQFAQRQFRFFALVFASGFA